MLYVVHDIRDRGTHPNFELLGAMIYYIDTVPERFHHPKEDQYLFRLLRHPMPEGCSTGDRGTRDGAERFERWNRCWRASAAAPPISRVPAAVEAYWQHMREARKSCRWHGSICFRRIGRRSTLHFSVITIRCLVPKRGPGMKRCSGASSTWRHHRSASDPAPGFRSAPAGSNSSVVMVRRGVSRLARASVPPIVSVTQTRVLG